MSEHLHPLAGVHALANRPGIRGRNLIGSEHGVTSLFVSELIMDEGASIPLHTHPTEEAFLVTDGRLTMQVGDETLIARADSVVRIPPGVPHALRNEASEAVRALGAGAWNRATWFTTATTYLEGTPRTE